MTNQHNLISLKDGLDIIRRTSEAMLKLTLNGTPVRKQAFILYSLPGVGKSEGLRSLAKSEHHVRVIDINAEFGGSLAMPIQSIEDGRARVLHALHEDIDDLKMHAEQHPEDVHYLVLDEFNRGDEFMKQTLMQLLLNVRVPGHELPENIFIVGAGNTAENVFTDEDIENFVEPLDVAARDRVAPLFIRLSVENWIDWGYANGVNAKVLDFIDRHEQKEQVLYRAPSTADGTGATPRAWAKLSQLLDIFDFRTEGASKIKAIISSQIGSELADEFFNYAISEPYYDLDDLLATPSRALEKFMVLDDTTRRQAICAMPVYIDNKLKAGERHAFDAFIELLATPDQLALQRFMRVFVENDTLARIHHTFNIESRKNETFKSLVAQFSAAS